ncbi:hypothetical protein BJV82DRAFT_584211 [Fennellomyces sp. T-0311]|nr:hypothetical protein BJV82DRAFT_584211 [Fennellomyces sp. T-0311]
MNNEAALNTFPSFREDISEFKAIMATNFGDTNAAIKELKDTVSELKGTVAELVETIADMKKECQQYLTQAQESFDNGLTYPDVRPDKNPFKNLMIKRDALHLKKPNGGNRPWHWDLFKILGQEVLGSKPLDENYFETFKKNVQLFSNSLARRYGIKTRMAKNDTWGNVGDESQNMLMKSLEEGIGSQYPLTACVE